MKHRVRLQTEAETDIDDAVAWYERQRPKLGREFIAEIESALDEIAENPLRYPCLRRTPEVRRSLCRRFPYRIFFVHHDREVVIFRVLHCARDDREWESSLPVD